jgi:hypothetical protein
MYVSPLPIGPVTSECFPIDILHVCAALFNFWNRCEFY